MDFFGLFGGEKSETSKSQLTGIERRIDSLLLALGVPAPDKADEFSLAVRSFLEQGRTLEAIKQYRLDAGVDLKTAKEAIERGESVSAASRIEAKLDAILSNLGITLTAPSASDTPQMEEIVAELRAGRKLNAIKLYREMTHLGLKECKDAIDRLERDIKNR